MKLTPETAETTLNVFLQEMRGRLDDAASIGKAAAACAETGNVHKGIEIALDIEQLLYEANIFLNAASMIHRLRRTS